MGDSAFDILRMTRDQTDLFLKPFRDQHEQILRALAPFQGTEDLLRDLSKSFDAVSSYALLGSGGSREQLSKALGAIDRTHLQDFSGLLAMSSTHVRDIALLKGLVSNQSRWIEEALRITNPGAGLSATLASIEKLTANQRVLLDDAVWGTPRPFSHALADILIAGRAGWALSKEQQARIAPEEQARAEALIGGSETAIEEIAAAGESRPVAVSLEEAAEQVPRVTSLLVAEARVVSPGSPLVLDPVLTGGIAFLFTITEVMRLVETRHRKALAGGYACWILQSALELLSPTRSAQDRFDSLVEFLYNFFIDGVNYTDQALRSARPAFFDGVVQDLRNNHVSHAPEAATPLRRIGPNLARREQRLRSLGGGRVPVTPAEWNAALLELLRRAADAAVEFRDRL